MQSFRNLKVLTGQKCGNVLPVWDFQNGVSLPDIQVIGGSLPCLTIVADKDHVSQAEGISVAGDGSDFELHDCSRKGLLVITPTRVHWSLVD